MTTERIVAELVLDDGKFNVRIRQNSAEARAFKAALESLNRSVNKVEKSTHGSIASLTRWSVIIGQSRNVIHQLWFVTGQWMTSIVKTNAEIERMTFLLKGMSKASDEAGKSAEAAANVNQLFDMAKSAPFNIQSLTDSFVKFKSVGLDPMDGSLQSLVDATAAFGGTGETLARASIAIQQMGGKGVISMEELRQQLGEAVPQAITIMAQSLGTSYGELVDVISKGKLVAGPALDAMFGGFQMAFGGRAQSLMDTFNGRVAVLSTTWAELLKESDGIQSFFESVKDLVKTTSDFLGSKFGMDLADGIGGFLSSVTDGISYLIEKTAFFSGQFWSLISTVNNAAMDPDSFVNTLWNAFKGMAQLGGEIISVLGIIAKETGLAMMNMTEQEFTDMMFANRVAGGADFLEEELDKLMEVYDRKGVELEQARVDAAKALEDLRGTLAGGGAADVFIKDGNVIGFEQLDQMARQFLVAKDDFEAAQSKVQAMREELAGIESQIAQGKGADVSDREWGVLVQAREDLQLFIEDANRDLGLLNETYKSSMNALSTMVGMKGESEAEVMAFIGQNVDVLREKLGSMSSDQTLEANLTALANSGSESVAQAAQSVIDLRNKIESLTGERIDFAHIIHGELDEAVQAQVDGAMKEIEKFQSEVATAGATALEEASKVRQDTSLSEEERISGATEILNGYFDMQMNGLNAILESSIASMNTQSVAGAEAAVALGQIVMGILAQIEATRAKVVANMTTGMTLGDGKLGGGGKSPGQRALEKLQEMIKEAQEKGDELQRRVVDPFAYELPKAIESARKKLNKMAEDLGGGQWTADMKRAFDMIATNEMTEEMLDMADATREIRRELMGERRAREEGFREETDRLRKMKARLIEMGIWRVEWETIVQEQIAALRDQMESETPWGEFANEWKNYFDDLESWAVDAIKSVSGALADMVTEGEGNFADLARAALNSFLEIQFAAVMSGVADLIGGAVKGWIGGMGGSTSAKVSHSGDIVGSQNRSRMVDSAIWMNAPRYHTGGVIGQEVPAILEKGEGVFTAEQMKAIGKGMSGGKEAKVNLINNTGMPMDAEETSVKFSPDGMILDVVLKNMSRPGPFRDGMMRMSKK